MAGEIEGERQHPDVGEGVDVAYIPAAHPDVAAVSEERDAGVDRGAYP